MAENNKGLQPSYEFGPFRLEPAEGLLLRNNQPIPLSPKAFETLIMLVQRSGHLVEKHELMKALWPDSFVEEGNLNHQVWTVRKALGDLQNGNGYIETVPKRGYRFTASVRERCNSDDALVVEKHSFTRIVTEEDVQADGRSNVARQSLSVAPASREKSSGSRWNARVASGILCLLAIGAFLVRDPPWSVEQKRIADASITRKPLRSIAVLPFKTIGSESYLGIGLSDALITRLGNIHQITVRPTSAVRKYVDPNQDPLAIGRQQGVDAVLDGSVQKVDDRIRLTVQLFRVADGVSLWSGQFDDRLTDLFSVQDSISRQVTQGLLVTLSDEENKRFLNSQVKAEAYQAYIKGRYFWNKRNDEGFSKAVEYFNQAIAIDPNYALAHAGLADAYIFLSGSDTLTRTERLSKARAAAHRALELDATLAEPHSSLGLIAMNYDWDWATSEREHRRAIELNPNYPTAHHWYAEYLAAVGRFDEAVTEINRAHELDPLSLILNTDMGKVLYFAGHDDKAIEQLHKTLEMDPAFVQARIWLGLAYEAKGLHDQAIGELDKTKGSDYQSWGQAFLGFVYATKGNDAEARDVLNELKQASKQRDIDPMAMTAVYIGLGEKDLAFAWLEKEYEVRSTGLTSLKVHPVYDSLRSDPRFADLMRRVGLAP